jgi:hypothetical protein
MSYIDPGAGESFVFRTRKSIIAQPTRRWFNTYEARFFGSPSTEALDQLGEGLCVYEQTMLLNIYQVDSVTISTWTEDSTPYNPAAFVTTPKNKIGERAIGIGTPAPLRDTLFIRRIVESGRIGRLFLRGVLLRGDLTTTSGENALADLSAMNTLHDTALGAGELAQFFITGEQTLKLALIGTLQVTREYEDLQVGGYADVKLNHKYFDHA